MRKYDFHFILADAALGFQKDSCRQLTKFLIFLRKSRVIEGSLEDHQNKKTSREKTTAEKKQQRKTALHLKEFVLPFLAEGSAVVSLSKLLFVRILCLSLNSLIEADEQTVAMIIQMKTLLQDGSKPFEPSAGHPLSR